MGILATNPFNKKSHTKIPLGHQWVRKTNYQIEYYRLIKFNNEERILQFKYDLNLPDI